MREVDINRGTLLVRRERVALVRLHKVPALEGAPVCAGALPPIAIFLDESKHKHRITFDSLFYQAARSQTGELYLSSDEETWVFNAARL